MKPPRRPRLIPARFLRLSPSPERPQRGPWGLREKRALLEALRAEAQRGLPEQRLAAALRERLPRRSEEEIRALLVRLRGRAAREALTSKFRNFLRFQRRVRAPIQVWQDLAETLVGGVLEGPPRAAFSQVLTLAATEPLTLDHSRPPQNSGTPPHLEPSQNSGTPPEVGTPQNSGSPQSRGGCRWILGGFTSSWRGSARGGRGPPCPPQRPRWFCPYWERCRPNWEHWGGWGGWGGSGRHLRGLWGSLSAPPAPAGPPQSPEPAQCPPLNPLLVPLVLLGRAG